jgi:hypothetical protein
MTIYIKKNKNIQMLGQLDATMAHIATCRFSSIANKIL